MQRIQAAGRTSERLSGTDNSQEASVSDYLLPLSLNDLFDRKRLFMKLTGAQ
jgi:hypothetical protein